MVRLRSYTLTTKSKSGSLFGIKNLNQMIQELYQKIFQKTTLFKIKQ